VKTNGHQAIALSLDDGPDWGEQSLVLALNSAVMKVTFFWTWQKVQLLRQRSASRFNKPEDCSAPGLAGNLDIDVTFQ
jgi:hypothetical protein